MTITQNERFNELLKEITSLAPKSVVSLKIVITADETRVTEKHKYSEELKKRSQSMRNITGEWM
jgi:hypothetical protein